jgi:hypothetical protein
VLTQGRDDVVGVRPSLVVFGLIHPQYFSTRINQQRSWDGQGLRGDRRRRTGVETRVAQAEGVGHLECSIREHCGAESMLAMSLCDRSRGVGADRQDRHAPLVEFGPKFFPSP